MVRKLAEAFEVGARIGDWEVVAAIIRDATDAQRRNGQKRVQCSVVRCCCGKERTLSNGYLRVGRSLGCGCRRAERWQKGRRSHGKSRTALYGLWASIKHRLINERTYEGIRMYEPWQHNFVAFEAFILNLGPKPTPEHTLDRIDPNGDYVPGNLRWADKAMQTANRRPNDFSYLANRIPGKHGLTHTDTYRLWRVTKSRLQKNLNYARIRMYEPWVKDFAAFNAYIESLGPKPTPQHSLDRIDPAGDYAPGNLRWADKTTQSENRRNNKTRQLQTKSVVSVGQKYDMLTVVELVIIEKHSVTWYGAKVQCECGTIKTVYQKQLLSGRTKSCGCFKNTNLRLGHKALEKPITIDGETLSLRAWSRRQGISPQVIWNRIHRLGWDPAEAVKRPLREVKQIEVKGEKLSAEEWSARHGVPARVIVKRLEQFGWDPELAVTQPVRGWRRKAA